MMALSHKGVSEYDTHYDVLSTSDSGPAVHVASEGASVREEGAEGIVL
jgi:hypothetical protein